MDRPTNWPAFAEEVITGQGVEGRGREQKVAKEAKRGRDERLGPGVKTTRLSKNIDPRARHAININCTHVDLRSQVGRHCPSGGIL